MKKIILTAAALLFGIALYATDPPIKTGVKGDAKDLKNKKVKVQKKITKKDFSTLQIPQKSVLKNSKSTPTSSDVKPASAKAKKSSERK
ncbi:MAG: hypothetical protein JW857_01165 [Bacteroidales bacterium]|nr:hypothetical protein [Bacteroidales bacterium]